MNKGTRRSECVSIKIESRSVICFYILEVCVIEKEKIFEIRAVKVRSMH